MSFNIYICGVGGQGVGVLAAAAAHAAMAAGHKVRGCDTHGLAQRHGSVASHLRLGADAFAPRVPAASADLVLALERLEALRAAESMLKPGGALIWYDTVYQPVSVRTGSRRYPSAAEVEEAAARLGASARSVSMPGLPDPRMQNSALLGAVAAAGAVKGVGEAELAAALKAALPPKALEANLRVFGAALRNEKV